MNANVDILLAVYNGEMYLEQQLLSIREQTHKNWKLLVRDDGSSDGSMKIIEKYLGELNIEIITDKMGSLGATGNFSALLKHSDASYIMFCDQDDVWHSNKIEIMLSELKRSEKTYGLEMPLLLFSDLSIVDKNLKLIASSLWNHIGLNPEKIEFGSLLVQNPAWGCTICFNRSLANVVGEIPRGAILHDRWLMLAAAAFGKISHIPQSTIQYRQHEKNASEVSKASFISWTSIHNKYKKSITDKETFILQATCFINRYIKQLPYHIEVQAKFMSHYNENSWLARRKGLINFNMLYNSNFKKIVQFLSW